AEVMKKAMMLYIVPPRGVKALVNRYWKIVLSTPNPASSNGRPVRIMMAEILSAEDIDLIISFETGTPGTGEWLRQWNTPYGVPQITGCIGVSVPGMIPYINSGQLSAMMPGLTVSAEYEVLTNNPGLAVAGVDAVSTSHLMVIMLVILGNITYFMTKEEGL
ncbi:unnamed protein product, partial [marine sediment metagenome]